MAILVTGAAGFIGSYVCKKLLESGKTVIGIDSLNDYYEVSLKQARLKNIQDSPESSKFNFIRGDIADYDSLAEKLVVGVVVVPLVVGGGGVEVDEVPLVSVPFVEGDAGVVPLVVLPLAAGRKGAARRRQTASALKGNMNSMEEPARRGVNTALTVP